jgi:hypothetical protein
MVSSPACAVSSSSPAAICAICCRDCEFVDNSTKILQFCYQFTGVSLACAGAFGDYATDRGVFQPAVVSAYTYKSNIEYLKLFAKYADTDGGPRHSTAAQSP